MPDDVSLYDLPLVTIRRVSVTEMDNNVYLLTSKDSGAQVLIDAAGGIRKIRRMLDLSANDASEMTRLSLIITTHSHYDHIRALRELVDETGVRSAAGAADASAIAGQTGIKPDVQLKNRDIVAVEGFDLSVIHLRGHTPGSIALAYDPGRGLPVHLFTGDSLFPGGVGNTNKDPERFASLFGDVTSRIFDVYGDDTVVLPGHGKPTTLGAERPHLAEWQQRGW
ncbi:MAG TPA: MBL fold metallo-hydrolase [Propionibacteriaceae bacterium]|nr:MBL fold metallo-hydrolase [Propionibacteriaceae bacterium]